MVVLCTVVAAGCGSGQARKSLPGLTSPKLVRLTKIARDSFKGMAGDQRPSSATVFATSRHEVNIVDGPGTVSPGSQGVYLVVVRGHFTCTSCSIWPGGRLSRGDFALVLDRKTLRFLDESIGGRVNTSKLGPGVPLQLGKA